jgi:hypothetical protein
VEELSRSILSGSVIVKTDKKRSLTNSQAASPSVFPFVSQPIDLSGWRPVLSVLQRVCSHSGARFGNGTANPAINILQLILIDDFSRTRLYSYGFHRYSSAGEESPEKLRATGGE